MFRVLGAVQLGLLLFLLGLSPSLYAQEEAPESETQAAPETSPAETPPLDLTQVSTSAGESPSPEQQILEMDIKTSSLAELAAWCRSLGLSEGGTKEELANRLRSYFTLPLPQPDQAAPESAEGTPKPKKQTVITIESARSTEYFTLEVVDEEYARLRGNVVVSLKEEDAVHRISAEEVLYNRTRNVMSASGGVEYRKETGDTIETFKGASITVNLDDWSSIFVGGVTEKSVTDNTTAYEFAGTLISRSDEEVTIMTHATISNAKNPDALWSLQAYKLWLLPGSDWAVLSAVLKVGEIPVLYIPFFYFPADEIIFHPVVGTRSREGNFVQTTTYVLGRPKTNPASESSISKILGSSADMEKTRQGLFLRSTGHKSRDPNDTRLSVLFDAYSNLGAYLGTELILPRKGIFGGMDLSGGLGFTRTIYQLSSGYSPFAQYDGSDEWNKAYFFSKEIPFRYRLNTKGSLSGKYGSFTWAFPFYADPFVDQDFLDRSEEMDWITMFKGDTGEEETTTTSALGSYEWRLSGAITPSVTVLNPYVSSFSVSNLSTSLSFRTRTSALVSAASPASPERVFFFPDKITLYSFSTSIAGTPLTIGGPKTSLAPKTDTETPDPFQGIGIPRSPWEYPEESEKVGDNPSPVDQLTPPKLSQQFTIPKSGGPRLAFDYRFAPTGASELQYRSSLQNWPEREAIDWQEVSSILTTFGSDGSLGFTLSQPETSLYTSSLHFSGNGRWQGYTHINEEAEEFNTPQALDNARLRAYNATLFTTSYDFSTTVKPFYFDSIWGNTNFQYSLKGLLVKSIFDGTSTDPSWDLQYGKWDKEDLTTHQAAANIAASVMDKVQNLTITADIPPEDTTLAGNAIFRVWQTETTLRGKILEPYDIENRKFEPVYFIETLRFGAHNASSLQQQVTYDPELKEYTNFTTSLSWAWAGLSASYTAIRSRTYTLESTGWVQSTAEETLNPLDFRLGYTKTFKKDNLWNKRLSFSFNVNSNVSFDLQRYTYSRYSFIMGFTLGISNFLDISLNTTSENAVVFRYFQNLPFFDLPVELPGEQNFLVDLFNSFRFDDDTLRRSSGFKLKSFRLNLVHHLGDWNAKLGITLSPYLDQSGSRPVYKFNNEISFLIQWVPISEIKTEITANKDKIVFK
ncbi:MAG: LPS-assembly protein LptD [Treponema sp.]|nr:LPS-assembly protein LptD [Treponema sp.]